MIDKNTPHIYVLVFPEKCFNDDGICHSLINCGGYYKHVDVKRQINGLVVKHRMIDITTPCLNIYIACHLRLDRFLRTYLWSILGNKSRLVCSSFTTFI